MGSSVRARTTTGAVAIVGIALAIASFAIVTLTRQGLERNVVSNARLRAADIVTELERGRSPDTLTSGTDDDVILQILDESNEILAASDSLRGDPPLEHVAPGEHLVVDDPPIGDDDPFAVVSSLAITPSGTMKVLVGRNLDLVRETSATMTKLFLLGVPLLLLVVGGTTWVVTGRSLAPVEAIRQEVAAISASELHRRVPEPDGTDEIARLARTMNDMLGRLNNAIDRQRQLVSDASHELRNPIATIGHHAEVALAHPESTDSATLATDVLAESHRLQRLAEDLLFLARSDERAIAENLRSVDLDDLVLEEARRLKETRELTVEVQGVTAARTTGDAPQLQRMIRNLADNAGRHAVGRVSFSLGSSGDRIALRVDDDGPGIPHAARDRIFERFTRLDEARDRNHGGAGLGLAIVAEVVTAHQGSIAVEDSPLGGARFTVLLPLA